MNEHWCEWHVIVVEGSDTDDRQVTVMHPECDFTFTRGNLGEFNWHCQIQHEIDACGFDTLLGDRDGDGWYRARMRHYTTRGFDWAEIDCEYEVEALTGWSRPEEV